MFVNICFFSSLPDDLCHQDCEPCYSLARRTLVTRVWLVCEQGGTKGNPYIQDQYFEYSVRIDPTSRECKLMQHRARVAWTVLCSESLTLGLQTMCPLFFLHE
jgi:hypothetical protein